MYFIFFEKYCNKFYLVIKFQQFQYYFSVLFIYMLYICFYQVNYIKKINILIFFYYLRAMAAVLEPLQQAYQPLPQLSHSFRANRCHRLWQRLCNRCYSSMAAVLKPLPQIAYGSGFETAAIEDLWQRFQNRCYRSSIAAVSKPLLQAIYGSGSYNRCNNRCHRAMATATVAAVT